MEVPDDGWLVSEDGDNRGWDSVGRELVADRVRQARLENGVSQQELAFDADMHRTHLVRFEQGNVNLSLDGLFALAEALGVEPAELIPTRDEIRSERRRRKKS
jgi:transcriptional regulator with XRE-family HTH domain